MKHKIVRVILQVREDYTIEDIKRLVEFGISGENIKLITIKQIKNESDTTTNT